MDYNLNRPRQMTFYNSIGSCYLRKTVNPENGLATKVDLIKKGQIVHSFRSDRQLKSYFVEQIVRNNEDSVIISDARNTDEILVNTKGKGINKYIRLHSNHLDTNGNLDKTVKYSIENIKHIDSLIVLTKQQKEDIVNRFGHFEKVKVIPHGIKTFPLLELHNKLNRDKIVVISRLVGLKQINHIIEAIKLIKNKVPKLTLEIYGNGKELENLKKLVATYKLEKNILFQGYTNNPIEVYKNSLFSLTTSKREGFSLGILESMSCGTPVISYNFKYGPDEIINNNENGLLVKMGDIDDLSKKILYLYSNPNKLESMSQKAREKTENCFSIGKIQNEWRQLFEKE